MANESNPVGWFEIPVSNMERAKAFYEHVLELELVLHPMGEHIMAWFPMIEGGYGATGALVVGEGYAPSSEGTLVYFSCPDIDAALARAEEKGGKNLQSKTSIGEHGFIGMALDTEGNRFAVHSLE